MDILKINGHDYSDYLESNGLSVEFTPIFSTITDLDGNTHSKMKNKKMSFSAKLGMISNENMERLDTDASMDYVMCVVNGREYRVTNTSVSVDSQYFDGEQIYWDATVAGEQA